MTMGDIQPSSGHELPGNTVRRLNDGWVMCVTEPDRYATPDEIVASEDFIPASVPGTAAEALEKAERFDRENPVPLDDKDIWYILRLGADEPGAAFLCFDGLATIAEVYHNGVLLLKSQSMFLSHQAPITLTGQDKLAICFRALGPQLAKKGPRARWRPQLITPAGLRLFRTTALGRMPGWCPQVQAVGPYRPISLVRQADDGVRDLEISASLDEWGNGRLRVRLRGIAGGTIHCCGQSGQLVGDGDRMIADLVIPAVAAWWPSTHGAPSLHPVELELDGVRHEISRAGFKRVEVERGANGQDFRLKINGVLVFCRGAVWTNADIVRLAGERKDYRPWLEKAAVAGMNMIRIGGTMTYESADFFAVCDELGLMVWQDLMLANFDYPAHDAGWKGQLTQEVEQLLVKTLAFASLTVVCGGSEVYQQAAMLGLPKETYEGPLTEVELPALVSRQRPDCVYVPNSPFGGAMPFSPNAGVTHYYGVGAYCRPLDDARRANVRFAAESLAFANVPVQATLDQYLPVSSVSDPSWKARVPRDRGASWDFEDVRDFYLKLLFDVEPERLRREDLRTYLDLSRVVSGEVIEATFAEWRRKDSSCNGALIWTLQDLLPGPGWGLIDATGRPKPVYYAAKRAFRPVQIALTDEGTNGMDVHLINDTADTRPVVAEISCLRDGAVKVVSGSKECLLAPHSRETIAATDFFGAFFDTAYSFRFGPPSHNVTVARLVAAETGEDIASSFHFPLGRASLSNAATLGVDLVEQQGGYALAISTDCFAQNIEIDVPGFEPEDNWFHLAPAKPRLVPLMGGEGRPAGEIRLAGGKSVIRF
jgi:beta-mannosidase